MKNASIFKLDTRTIENIVVVVNGGLDKKMDPLKFDKRVIRRNLNRGVVALEDYKEYLDRLPDLHQECEPIELSFKKDSAENDEGEVLAQGAESAPDNEE